MALLTCPDCDGPVSDLASACPRCGRPMGNQTTPAKSNSPAQGPSSSRISLGVALLGLLGIAGAAFWYTYGRGPQVPVDAWENCKTQMTTRLQAARAPIRFPDLAELRPFSSPSLDIDQLLEQYAGGEEATTASDTSPSGWQCSPHDYQVDAWIDIENRLGGHERLRFACCYGGAGSPRVWLSR